jgi:hypothetical protein
MTRLFCELETYKIGRNSDARWLIQIGRIVDDRPEERPRVAVAIDAIREAIGDQKIGRTRFRRRSANNNNADP